MRSSLTAQPQARRNEETYQMCNFVRVPFLGPDELLKGTVRHQLRDQPILIVGPRCEHDAVQPDDVLVP
jgi:hypothetical protein